jgi:hypothetical protein
MFEWPGRAKASTLFSLYFVPWASIVVNLQWSLPPCFAPHAAWNRGVSAISYVVDGCW